MIGWVGSTLYYFDLIASAARALETVVALRFVEFGFDYCPGRAAAGDTGSAIDSAARVAYAARLNKLKGEDFFYVDQNPLITFT